VTQQPVLADIGELSMSLRVIDGPIRYRYQAMLQHGDGTTDQGMLEDTVS
jgi:hypothetical protein